MKSIYNKFEILDNSFSFSDDEKKFIKEKFEELPRPIKLKITNESFNLKNYLFNLDYRDGEPDGKIEKRSINLFMENGDKF